MGLMENNKISHNLKWTNASQLTVCFSLSVHRNRHSRSLKYRETFPSFKFHFFFFFHSSCPLRNSSHASSQSLNSKKKKKKDCLLSTNTRENKCKLLSKNSIQVNENKRAAPQSKYIRNRELNSLGMRVALGKRAMATPG